METLFQPPKTDTPVFPVLCGGVHFRRLPSVGRNVDGQSRRAPKHLSVDAIAQLMLVVSGENSTPGNPVPNT